MTISWPDFEESQILYNLIDSFLHRFSPDWYQSVPLSTGSKILVERVWECHFSLADVNPLYISHTSTQYIPKRDVVTLSSQVWVFIFFSIWKVSWQCLLCWSNEPHNDAVEINNQHFVSTHTQARIHGLPRLFTTTPSLYSLPSVNLRGERYLMGNVLLQFQQYLWIKIQCPSKSQLLQLRQSKSRHIHLCHYMCQCNTKYFNTLIPWGKLSGPSIVWRSSNSICFK